MRLSRGGVILGGCYLALAAVLFLAGGLSDDPKASYVLLQFAVWPGLMLVLGLALLVGHGLDDALTASWINSFPAMLLLNLVLAYGLGWAVRRPRASARAGRPR